MFVMVNEEITNIILNHGQAAVLIPPPTRFCSPTVGAYMAPMKSTHALSVAASVVLPVGIVRPFVFGEAFASVEFVVDHVGAAETPKVPGVPVASTVAFRL